MFRILMWGRVTVSLGRGMDRHRQQQESRDGKDLNVREYIVGEKEREEGKRCVQ